MGLPRENRLNVCVRFVLFVTSYTPLFALIIINQLSKSPDNLVYGGFNFNSIIQRSVFWLAITLTSVIVESL